MTVFSGLVRVSCHVVKYVGLYLINIGCACVAHYHKPWFIYRGNQVAHPYGETLTNTYGLPFVLAQVRRAVNWFTWPTWAKTELEQTGHTHRTHRTHRPQRNALRFPAFSLMRSIFGR